MFADPNFAKTFALITIVLTFWINFYKFKQISVCMDTNTTYKFPIWHSEPHTSKSTPLWLFTHLAISLIESLLTGFFIFRMANDNRFIHYLEDKNTFYGFIYQVNHYGFFVTIVNNIGNLGSLPIPLAVVINLSLVILFILAHTSPNLRGLTMYMLLISIPVYLEAIFYLSYLLS